jgi:hypothetical protein
VRVTLIYNLDAGEGRHEQDDLVAALCSSPRPYGGS